MPDEAAGSIELARDRRRALSAATHAAGWDVLAFLSREQPRVSARLEGFEVKTPTGDPLAERN